MHYVASRSSMFNQLDERQPMGRFYVHIKRICHGEVRRLEGSLAAEAALDLRRLRGPDTFSSF